MDERSDYFHVRYRGVIYLGEDSIDQSFYYGKSIVAKAFTYC